MTALSGVIQAIPRGSPIILVHDPTLRLLVLNPLCLMGAAPNMCMAHSFMSSAILLRVFPDHPLQNNISSDTVTLHCLLSFPHPYSTEHLRYYVFVYLFLISSHQKLCNIRKFPFLLHPSPKRLSGTEKVFNEYFCKE